LFVGTNNASGTGNLFNTPQFINHGNPSFAPFTAGTYDYHVNLFSTALNAGDNSFLIPAYNTDLDSLPRIFASSVDIGCYENNYCTYNLSISTPDSSTICSGASATLVASSGTTFLWSNGLTTPGISATSAGIYTVQADSGGCLGSATFNLSVIVPTVTVSGTVGLCLGDSGVLFANGGPSIQSYLWNTGSTTDTIHIHTGGNYSVSVITAGGCQTNDAISVVNFPQPNAVISFNNVVLVTGSFSSYQWLLNGNSIPGATLAQYPPTLNGNYSVVVTNSNGCKDTSAIFALNNVGLSNYKVNQLRIFPNPFQDKIFITDCAEITEILLKDIHGKVWAHLFYNDQPEILIETNTLDSGIYFLEIISSGNRDFVKCVKN
jgi:hypothetical protein